MRQLKVVIIVILVLFFGLFSRNDFVSNLVNGQSSLDAPTGFSASDGDYNNKVGLNWDTIRGATNYRIFRNTVNNSSTATEVGTTPMAFFFDGTANPGQTYFYWVRSENGGFISGLSQPDTGIRAIGIQQGPIPPLEPPPPGPPANPGNATKAYLGKTLFWDEQLSSTKTVSCGTCHRAGTGGSDPRTIVNSFRANNPGADNAFGTPDDVFGSPGVPSNLADGTYQFSNTFGFREQVTNRKSPSFINAAYSPLLFWDGRATGTYRDPITNAIIINNGGALESQSSGPPVSAVEMAHAASSWSVVAQQVAASKPLALSPNVPLPLTNWINGRTYPELFLEAFGTSEVTPARISLAIGAYERTLFADRTPLDLDAAGITPLTQQEQRGRGVFGGNDCAICHAGNLFTDNSFRNIGVRPVSEDNGRFLVTGQQADLGKFKVPGLRNVALRGPFFHNGRFQTLEQVVDFYDRGGDFPNEPNVPNNLIRPRGLSPQQKADLLAFLRRPLTDPRVQNGLPPFDSPALYADSNRVPQIVGTGTAGSGGQVPQPLAIEPPIVGNSSFTVAVTNALGASNAVLVINDPDPGTTSIPAGGSFYRTTLQLEGSGIGNGRGSVSIAIPDSANLVGRTFFGRWYVTDAGAAGGFSVSPAFRFTIFGQATAVANARHVDFDGDGKTDISVFRPSTAEWWYVKSSNGQNAATQFGATTDKIVPADFTGDGKTDFALWRPSSGEWFVLRSENNSFYSFPFGAAGDIPSTGDFDADGKSDAAIFRPSTGTWYILASSQGVSIMPFGSNGDIPQVGDYDGDGKSDIAVFRANGASGSEWWVNRSSGGVFATTFGTSTDKPVAADYTGDGKTDVAFWRPADGNWFVLRSEDLTYFAAPFGIASDIPAPGDYDGDGKTDFAVFRAASGTWYLNRSTSGVLISSFGTSGDYPAPAAYVP